MRVLNYYENLRVKRWYVRHLPLNTYAQGNQVNVPVPNQHLPLNYCLPQHPPPSPSNVFPLAKPLSIKILCVVVPTKWVTVGVWED